MKILILGVNGFIGSHLVEAILDRTDWEIYGMDLGDNFLVEAKNNPRFHFKKGDITQEKKWIEDHIKQCDVLLPLVAVATPASYVENPLRVFELDFEANLAVVRLAFQHGKRVVFPSTSEVYGMCPDKQFDEEKSNLVLGPINKPRWIYSCSKQMMDRVIFAYGMRGAKFSLFRPFNWIGPRLDEIPMTQGKKVRVLTQFMGNLLRGENLELVDGGKQARAFLYIDDGINCLLKIIENKNDCALGKIFNVGHPDNVATIRELAELLMEEAQAHPLYGQLPGTSRIVSTSAEQYYGKGYQDAAARTPLIENARRCLGWEPVTDLRTAIQKTVDYYLRAYSGMEWQTENERVVAG